MKYSQLAAFAIALMLALCGCETKVQTADKPSPSKDIPNAATTGATTPQPEPTDKEKIALLRAEAHKRGLRWSVICEDYETPDKQFFAMATDRRAPLAAQYIEDGATPWWAEHGATQADAAYRLYQSIQQPPNMYPKNKEKEKHTHKYCPPVLRGE